MGSAPLHNAELPWALIGAGPMGLAMAKNLREQQIPFEGFEAHTDVGGLWDISAKRSTVYKTAHLISSKTTTEFSDFPMPEDTPDYPRHDLLLQYFQRFAEHYRLREHYHFSCCVDAAEPVDNGWQVSWTDADGQAHKKLFAGLLIANGTLAAPNKPILEGQFDGELIHAARYKSPEQFRDKRVLVVGAGNSGCDIVVDAANHGSKADLSVRRGYHFVPKYLFGKPADTLGGLVKLPIKLKRKVDSLLLRAFVGDPTRFGFPSPDHALYESHPIVNSLVLFHLGHGDVQVRPDIDYLEGQTVHFKDGSQDDYDVIVTATGYRLDYPFIDRELLNWQNDAPHLYLNCFHPSRDDLFVLGMVEASGLGWQGRHEQAELVACYIRGRQQNSATAREFASTKAGHFSDMRGGVDYLKLPRMAYYVHKDTYRKAVKQHLKAFRSEETSA
ncbi:MAG: flavin-containing monooxygenase [Granulosicoccaceae bacterium]